MEKKLTNDELGGKAISALEFGLFVVQNGFQRKVEPATAYSVHFSKRDGVVIDIRCFGNGKVSLRDYGKTWALTKEELE